MRNDPRKTGRSSNGDRHVRLHHWLMETEAWKSLNPVERSLYVEIARLYMGSNNGRLHFGIRHGVDALHLGNATVCRALQSLRDKGFIVAVRKGFFTRKQEGRTATEWRLTEFPCDVTGVPATKDFAKLTPKKTEALSISASLPMLRRNGTDAVAEKIW